MYSNADRVEGEGRGGGARGWRGFSIALVMLAVYVDQLYCNVNRYARCSL